MDENQDETPLQRSVESLRLSAQALDVAFLVGDCDWRSVLYSNPAYEKIFGRTGEALQADPDDWLAAVIDEERETVRAYLHRAQEGVGAALQFRIRHPRSGIRWIHWHNLALRGPDGRAFAILGVGEDVTACKTATAVNDEQRQLLDSVIVSAMDAILSVDADQRIVLANPAAEKMFGYGEGELLGLSLGDLIPSRFRIAHGRQVADFSHTGATHRYMGHMSVVYGQRRDGKEFPLEASISRNESSGNTRCTAILRDITERLRARQRIERLNKLYAVLSAVNGLIVRTPGREELFQQACNILLDVGHYRMAWIGRVDARSNRIEPMASAGAEEAFIEAIQYAYPLQAPAGRAETMAARAVRLGTVQVANDLRLAPDAYDAQDCLDRGLMAKAVLPLRVAGETSGLLALYAGEPEHFDEEEQRLLGGLANDLGHAIEVIDKAERLDYLSRFDPVTGLASQRLWSERLQARLSVLPADEPLRVAVFALNIENFRAVNQALGREGGDELLRQIAQRLRPYDLPETGRFARIGADQFAIFAMNMGPPAQVVHYLSQRLGETFHEPFRIDGTDVRVAAKAGIAMHPDDGTDAEALLRNAEAALKAAKLGGHRYAFFTPAMAAQASKRLAMEGRLRQAIEQEEFVLHYQPKVSLDGYRLLGSEALIRWNDPNSGLVPPGLFIPILEETGLIHEVGRWAMRKAIEQYLAWRDAGLPAVRIAVNVSPLQLRTDGFAEEVAAALSIDARAPEAIELEITESVIMGDVKQNVQRLHTIRALGTPVAIDDFGTGFSSLSYLARLPVDTLKIDRAFINDMITGPDGMALVSTIINLGHSLRLSVVAEGVETEEQARLLRLLRCEQMQGFLYSKPVPAEVFAERFLGAAPVAAA